MTSEIAVMNQRAVALAADSAVTLVDGGLVAVRNDQRKLFNLVEGRPIGIMFFGLADMMGHPWDQLILHYQSKVRPASFAHVRDYAASFTGMLDNLKEFFPPDRYKEEYRRLLASVFRYVFHLAQFLRDSAEGDMAQAEEIYRQIVEHEPENAEAIAGLARAAIARKDLAAAKELLAKVPPAAAKHAEIAAANTALELAEAGEKAQGAFGELEARLRADPQDHQARLDLASALFAAGERERAIDELLDLVKRAREWNEQAARKQLVKFFEAMGLMDPLTVATRKRLSSILFS